MERRWMLSLLLLIGIVGYFTVPAVAGYIINPGGGNGLLNKVTSLSVMSLTNIQQTTSSGMQDSSAKDLYQNVSKKFKS